MPHARPFASTLLLGLTLLAAPAADAASAREIDVRVNDALDRFTREVSVADEFLADAKAVLVFPKVIKAGVGIGGEYGEGALRINGETAQYYSTAAASIGFQLGAQTKSVYLLFMEDEALEQFRNSDGWKIGVDGSVNLIKIGAGGSIDTQNAKDPILGFVLTRKGLMYNLTLEGTKISRIRR